MPEFTSSVKPIQYFGKTNLINKFARAVEDRLEGLEQIERNGLLSVLLVCLTLLEHEDGNNISAILPEIAKYSDNESFQKEDVGHDHVESQHEFFTRITEALNDVTPIAPD